MTLGREAADLGKTTTPCYYVGVDFLLGFLLMMDDSLQQTIQVLILAVIVLDEGLVPLR